MRASGLTTALLLGGLAAGLVAGCSEAPVVTAPPPLPVDSSETAAPSAEPSAAASAQPSPPPQAYVGRGSPTDPNCPAPSPVTPGRLSSSSMPLRAMCALPVEVGQLYQRVTGGGAKVASTAYPNNDQSLPPQRNGYYKQYVVPTPDTKGRSTRKLITGSEREVYYTSDDGQSFVLVDPKAVSAR